MYFGFEKERNLETIFEKRFQFELPDTILNFNPFLIKDDLNLLSYTYDTQRYWLGSFLCTKNKNIYFEENKFTERFGECSFFYIIKTQKH